MTKLVRKIVEIDEEKCDGCGLCVPNCAEGAIRIVDGKARLVSDSYCDGLGACLGHCPRGAIRIVQREAAPFDEQAAQQHLKAQQERPAVPAPAGCSGAALRVFAPSAGLARQTPSPDTPGNRTSSSKSALGQWPVQLRLVPPNAPFLRGSRLLLAADCVPFAYADFHADLLSGHTLLVGCPKLDDVETYVQRLAQIISQANLQSITVARMEVPCCGGLMWLVHSAIKQAGKQVAVEQVVISIDGRRSPLVSAPAGRSGS